MVFTSFLGCCGLPVREGAPESQRSEAGFSVLRLVFLRAENLAERGQPFAPAKRHADSELRNERLALYARAVAPGVPIERDVVEYSACVNGHETVDREPIR